MFDCKREEVTAGWRKLCSKGLHDSYSLSNIIKMIELRRMWWWVI
jgi:hypothetical protein